MKKIFLKFLFTFILLATSISTAKAVQFDILVLPTDIFHVCDNYFCFPEPSEITSDYVINNLNSYKNIKAIELSEVRAKLNLEPELKLATENMLKDYEGSEKIDFSTLSKLSKEFGVKSILLISSYSSTDKTTLRRNLWEVLEIANAFKISYPFNLTTTAVLTDTVNSVVMWSGKYSKTVSDTNGYFLATNHALAVSQLEKLKQYNKNNVSVNISQNVRLRFFPKDVKTFEVKKQVNEEDKPKFVPNALEHLIKPQMLRELDEGTANTDPADDFIFEF